MESSSLRQTILKQLVSWLLIPGILFSVITGSYLAYSQIRSLEHENHELASSLELYVREYLSNALASLRYLTFVDSLDSRDEAVDALKSMKAANPLFERVIWVAPNKDIIADYPSGQAGLDFPVLFGGQNNPEAIHTKPIYSAETGLLTVYVRQPMTDGGYIIGELNLENLQRQLALFAPRASGRKIILSDGYGNLIAHPESQKVRQQANIGDLQLVSNRSKEAFLFKLVHYRGEYLFGARMIITPMNWNLIIIRPAMESLLPIMGITITLILICLLFSASAFFFLHRDLYKQVVDPIMNLATALQTFSSAHMHIPRLPKATFAELDTLRTVFGRLIKTIHERQERLANSEERYRAIYENAIEGIFQTTLDGKILAANPAFAKMIGHSTVDEFLNSVSNANELYVQTERRAVLLGILMERGEASNFEVMLYRRDGGIIWCSINAKAFFNEEGGVDYLEGFMTETTQRRLAEEALKLSEERFRALFEESPDAIFLLTEHDTIVDANRAAQQLFGYSIKEFAALVVADLFAPQDKGAPGTVVGRQIGRGAQEFMCKRRDGSYFAADVTTKKFRVGQIDIVLSSIRDITDRKRAEDNIKSSLQEKDILLKEVHHRVKNNLQIISSLLNLQAESIDEPKDLEPFIESQNRIGSMALVHEELYRSNDFSSINLAEYVRKMLSRLLYSFGARSRMIAVENIREVHLSIDQAIPCGLVFNELVTNVIKHAYPDLKNGEEGVIAVSVLYEEDQVLMEVADKGRGLPEDFVLEESQSLGMQLVMNLVDQLEGELEIVPNEPSGTIFRLRFDKAFV